MSHRMTPQQFRAAVRARATDEATLTDPITLRDAERLRALAHSPFMIDDDRSFLYDLAFCLNERIAAMAVKSTAVEGLPELRAVLNGIRQKAQDDMRQIEALASEFGTRPHKSTTYQDAQAILMWAQQGLQMIDGHYPPRMAQPADAAA